MDIADLKTQPDAGRRADLIRPLLINETDNETWLAETYAYVAWSHLTEPGDSMAGALIGKFGARLALEHAIHSTADEIRDDLYAKTQWQMMHPEELEAALKRWLPRWNAEVIERSLTHAATRGIRVVTEWDEVWPEGFDGLGYSAPHVLWLRGDSDVLSRPSVAYVGARAATSYGEMVVGELSSSTSRTHVIVSGGAYGIDGAAHRATMASAGKTVAYLAGGVDRPYPAGHTALQDRIAATSGALVSEVPPGASPTKWRFLSRNRLIAAHAQATVVVEAGARSGSLNTAGHAVSLGRPLGAVPGPISSAASAGCHRIIREMEGILITGPDDVYDLLKKEGE